jgi:hypothetical protein
MIGKHRYTLGLFASGAMLLLFSSWLLQITLPPRDLNPRPAIRKTLRAGRGQRRSEAAPNVGPMPIVWDFDVHSRDTAA